MCSCVNCSNVPRHPVPHGIWHNILGRTVAKQSVRVSSIPQRAVACRMLDTQVGSACTRDMGASDRPPTSCRRQWAHAACDAELSHTLQHHIHAQMHISMYKVSHVEWRAGSSRSNQPLATVGNSAANCNDTMHCMKQAPSVSCAEHATAGGAGGCEATCCCCRC